MTASTKPTGVVFHPGCFDNFQGTQEELDALVKNIQEVFVSGDIWRGAEPLTEEEIDEVLSELGEIELTEPNTRQ